MHELFRGFMHYAYYHVHGEIKDAQYPVDHFFFMGSPAVQEFVDQTDFRHEIPDFLKGELVERISERTGAFHPELKEPLKQLKSQAFDTLLLEVIELLFRYYGKESSVYLGFKAASCEQFVQPLSRTFPNIKVINIIRDPRAVICSNYMSTSLYPLVFSIRDWRKSVYYSWHYLEKDNPFKDKFTLVKYENLVSSPLKTLTGITQFLGLEFSNEMINNKFKPPNTSYASSEDGSSGAGNESKISMNYKEKWKNHLPVDKRIQIEVFCQPEMKKMGYTDFYDGGIIFNKFSLLFSKENEHMKLGEWCKKLLPPSFIYPTFWSAYQRGIELIRLGIYYLKLKIIPRFLLKKFFYKKSYFEWLRTSNH